jgi:class 3 adenylate cyclase
MYDPDGVNQEQTNSRIYLEYLLGRLALKPELEVEITQTVELIFGQDKAVLILDMSGFCRKTRRHGIVRVLSIIHQMRELILPVIKKENGEFIKCEADNLFCIFDSVTDAIKASRNINELLISRNQSADKDCQINVSIGIGYGHILNIENRDLFGDEVNLASKLSEDIAGKGNILLTENALAQFRQAETFTFEEIEISGVSLDYHKIQ